jgi:hypothetical protein
MLVYPTHPYLTTDRGLADKGMQLCDMLLPLTADECFHKFHGLMLELRRRALSAVDCAAKEREATLAAKSMETAQFGGQTDEIFGFLDTEGVGPFVVLDGVSRRGL